MVPRSREIARSIHNKIGAERKALESTEYRELPLIFFTCLLQRCYKDKTERSANAATNLLVRHEDPP